MPRQYTRKSPLDRFWALVDTSGDCWLWQAHKTSNGYGHFMTEDRRRISAHRFSYTAANGPIPDGLFVLHRCDTRACVRPEHLFLGTHQDNMDDKVAKGRQATGQRLRPERRAKGDRNGSRSRPECLKRGSDHPNSKFTEEQVRSIRARYAAGGISQPQLAAEYGVTHSAIGRIVRRQQWGHVS